MCFSYDDVVEKDDISRTVKEVVEEVNVFKYIDDVSILIGLVKKRKFTPVVQ